MPDSLLIYIDPSDLETASWALSNDSGELTSKIETGPLASATTLSRLHRTTIILGGELVGFYLVDLPTKNRQKLLSAVPYALEEQLIDDIEDMHFVITDTPDGTAVACIRKQELRKILDALSSAEISPSAVVPSAICLSADNEHWAILYKDQDAILQVSKTRAITIDRGLIDDILFSEIQGIGVAPARLYLFQSSEEEPVVIDDDRLMDTEAFPISYNQHPLVVYCGNVRTASSLNLLQNEFKPNRKGDIDWKRWSIPIGLMILWLGITLGNSFYELSLLHEQNDALRIENDMIYKKAFPESKKIVNARVQMEQKLNGLRGIGGSSGIGLLELLSGTQAAFSGNSDAEIQSLNYRNKNLEAVLKTTNLSMIEKIKQSITDSGFRADIVSSSSEGGSVRASIRISAQENL